MKWIKSTNSWAIGSHAASWASVCAQTSIRIVRSREVDHIELRRQACGDESLIESIRFFEPKVWRTRRALSWHARSLRELLIDLRTTLLGPRASP